jgi:hypothetical protein
MENYLPFLKNNFLELLMILAGLIFAVFILIRWKYSVKFLKPIYLLIFLAISFWNIYLGFSRLLG